MKWQMYAKQDQFFGFEVFQGQQYKCSIPQVDCQENMTNQQQGLKKHSKPVHEGLTYRCTESDNQAKSQEPLRKHMKDHHIRNPCPCEFNYEPSIRTHKETIHERPMY